MYSFIATICATLTSAGAAVHYDTPEPMPLRADKVVHVGRYVGARHTPALENAQTTIFFKQDSAANSQHVPFVAYVVESPMVVRQRMLAANKTPDANYAINSMAPIIGTPANTSPAVPGPAPAPRPVGAGIKGGGF